MAYAIQCCTRCGKLEQGHTGYGDRYICVACHKDGWSVDAGGNLRNAEDEGRAIARRIRERLKTVPPIGPYKP